MSQTENEVTSSSKRAYRKGTPLSVSERKMRSVAHKRETHKAVNVFIRNSLKDKLDVLCLMHGVTQAKMIELLLEREPEGE